MEQRTRSAYWEERKHALGITREMPMASDWARHPGPSARHQPRTRAPHLTQLRAHEQAVARSVQGLERYVQTVQRSHRREVRLEQGRGRREWRDEFAAERVLAEGQVHGLARDAQAERAVQQIGRYLDT